MKEEFEQRMPMQKPSQFFLYLEILVLVLMFHLSVDIGISTQSNWMENNIVISPMVCTVKWTHHRAIHTLVQLPNLLNTIQLAPKKVAPMISTANSSSNIFKYRTNKKLISLISYKSIWFQFQPFHAKATKFGPPNYCTSFFTSGIWMGITSSLLCLGILLFGVFRMMSIKSNDRFDDPKGKPLIIKAQE